MKLHHAPTQQYQTVTAYDDHSVDLNAVHFVRSLFVLPELAPQDWAISNFDALTLADFEPIIARQPDVIILGTGIRQRFLPPALLSEITARQIGIESMSHQSACRTYNILMAEGRKVALAVIIPTPFSVVS